MVAIGWGKMKLIFKLGMPALTERIEHLLKFLVIVVLSRITLARAKTMVFQSTSLLCTSCARFPCVRAPTVVCMAWSYQPTEEGLSPKRLVHQNKFDTVESIFAFYTTFEAVSRIL